MPPANSTMLALGTTAPDFALPAPDGSVHSLEDCMGARGLLVTFICNHCPYVKHIFSELTALGHELPDLGLGMVGIMSNDIENYPDDAPDKMAETAREQDWRFPYLVDASQEVAKTYTAAVPMLQQPLLQASRCPRLPNPWRARATHPSHAPQPPCSVARHAHAICPRGMPTRYAHGGEVTPLQ